MLQRRGRSPFQGGGGIGVAGSDPSPAAQPDRAGNGHAVIDATTSDPPTDADAQLFDPFAAIYDRRNDLTGGYATEWLHGLLAGRHGERAIDLGCGGGQLALVLAEHYDQVRAIDLSQEMINLARVKRPHPRITYEQGDLNDVRGQYDLVVSVMALHHVPDLPNALDNIANLVRPGGLAVLIDNAGSHPKDRWTMYYWNVLGLVREVSQAWSRFRINMNGHWVAHMTSDRFLSPVEFVVTYQRAFPGVEVAPAAGVYAAVWQRPSSVDEPD